MTTDDDPEPARRALQRMQQELSTVVEAELDEVQRFAVRLLEADVIQQATVGRSDRGNIERYGYIRSIAACIELVNSSPDLRAAKLAAPLIRLMADLEDLNRGRVARALRPVKRSRKDAGPRSRRDSTLRGHLAGIVEGLMRRGGMSEPEATHWVRTRLSAHRVQLTVEQLIEWRKQARGAKRDDFMRVQFHKVQVVDWTEPEITADKLIDGFLALA